MHITEGYLPPLHALAWGAAATPVVLHGAWRLDRTLRRHPGARLLLGAAGGFAFVLSALKLPSLAGSSSHATGIGLSAILLGPAATAVVGTAVLLFQALLLAHGGLTTLGANACSMAIAGAYVGWVTFRLARTAGATPALAAFLAAALSDLATYAVTTLQLALAYPDAASGVAGSALKFGAVFLVTQLPLAVSEGFLTALVYRALLRHAAPELHALGHGQERVP